MSCGTLLKMDNHLDEQGQAKYSLDLSGSAIDMNSLVGKKVSLKWRSKIFDIHDGTEIKKSFGQGFSYKNFMKLAQCDLCYVKPELCHFAKGTCREPEWGEKHCMQPHIVYLSLTSGPKIGITRRSNIPHRWIDQGAIRALPILEVESRYHSGLIEVEVAKSIPDKTNWQKMLKGETEEVDLYDLREQIFGDLADTLDSLGARDLDEKEIAISYPILEAPKKVKSLDFEKNPLVEGTLMGIKAQYLIFDVGVINLRKFQGYQVELSV